jgi:hypothetical protein
MVRNSGGISAGRGGAAGRESGRTGEINGAVVVGVDLVDHVLELRLAGVLAEGAHDGAELLGGDLAIAVLVLGAGQHSAAVASGARVYGSGRRKVGRGQSLGAKGGVVDRTYEEGEGFLELGDLLFGQRVGLDGD